MTSGFRVGRLFGVDIRIDISWLLIFILVAWNLSAAFGEFHSDWGAGTRWGLALLAAGLFFASVLAHELAHSLTARGQGIPVRSITLFLFGGVSNIQREPKSPFSEFLITIVGPITSVLLGVLFLLIASVTFGEISFSVSDPMNVIQQFGPWATILLWLGSVNILVGVFNMIPGFPLDGGRVLRSIIWAVNNDLRKATRWASRIGQAIAWLMIFSGISMMFGARIPFFGTGFINGLWLVFIGWFLNSASQQSYRQILIRDLLDGVRVKRMMRTRVLMVSPDITVESLVNDHILGSDDQAFPVVENDRLVGMVTLQDVRSAERDRWDELTVGDIMTPQSKLITVSTQDDAADALNKLTQSDVRQLPVMEENEIAGLLRRRDIIRWLQLESHAKLA